jgi:hypothetical protein
MPEYLIHTIKKINGPFTNIPPGLFLYRIVTQDKSQPPNFFLVLFISEKPVQLKPRLEIIIRISQNQSNNPVADALLDNFGTKFKTREKGKTVEHIIKKKIIVDSVTNSLDSVYINLEKKVERDPPKVEEIPEFQKVRDTLFISLGLKKDLPVFKKNRKKTDPVS